MLRKLKEYVIPATVEEAWQEYSVGKTLLVSGGLAVGLREDSSTEKIVDLRGCPLHSVEIEDGYLAVGATVTLNQLLEAEISKRVAGGLLREVLWRAGSYQIRNMATLAGSVGQWYGWSDIIPTLLALGAKLRIYNGEYSVIDLAAFRSMKPKPIITHVLFPLDPSLVGTFVKIERTSFDIATVNAAFVANFEDGKIYNAKIAVGARPGPAQLVDLSNFDGKVLAEVVDSLVETAVESITFGSNDAASAWYREKLVSVHLKRSLLSLVNGRGSSKIPELKYMAAPFKAKPAKYEGHVEFELNGKLVKYSLRPYQSLLDLLRENGHREVKKGCDTANCGSCTVLVDGRAIYSCKFFAFAVNGRSVTTVKGIGDWLNPSPVQRILHDANAVQCGFCTPGLAMAATDVLSRYRIENQEDLQLLLKGNLCRCTGYVQQNRALMETASEL